jgi:hypothetical protein
LPSAAKRKSRAPKKSAGLTVGMVTAGWPPAAVPPITGLPEALYVPLAVASALIVGLPGIDSLPLAWIPPCAPAISGLPLIVRSPPTVSAAPGV